MNLTAQPPFPFRALPVSAQAILAKAFSGQLVPQDPTDEPASELLTRIRRERAATPTASAPRPRRSRKQPTLSQ